MENSPEIDHLIAARDILKKSLEKSRNIAAAVNETGSRLKEKSHNLSFLQSDIEKMACKFSLCKIRGHVDRAIGPAAAVMNVLDVVYELQDSLESDPITDLYAHLATIQRLEEALKLLSSNSSLVILWLEDVVQFLETNAPAVDDFYLVKVTKVLKILMELQAKGERFRQKGGVLSSAFDKLEIEFRHILTENKFPFPGYYSPLHSFTGETGIHPFSFPAPVVQGLQAITEVLAANNRLERCISVYAEVRITNARATLRALDLNYLDIQLSESDSVETVEDYIDQWDNHMEFAVRHLLQTEYRLCNDVYQKAGSGVWMSCFAKISTQCGFLEILHFGSTITKCKKEAVKLLKLLKIFATLDKLRLDFNDLFSRKYCVEIQNETRDLVKKVVHGACEIFWELLVQVELQRDSTPPPDGSIPRLVRFVTEYCNQLLEDENSSFLTRVLDIYQVWNSVKFKEDLLSNEIHSIMKALEINLETWAKRYNDRVLSYVFMMNNHRYLCSNVNETTLGDLMGHSWLSTLDKSVEYYATLYMQESWEKLLVLLSEEGLTLFPGGRAVDRSLVKKRLTVFCEAFDDIYKKQSKWILHDKALRWEICQLVVEAIVPPYKSYLQRFMPGLEHEADIGNHVKYTAESLENILCSLFEPKLGKYNSSKCTDLIGMKSAVMNGFSSTPTAAS